MQALFDFVNKELPAAIKAQDTVKIVEIAARALNGSLSIHPFADGNGRSCRLLANYILLKGGLPPAILDDKLGMNAVFGDDLIIVNEFIKQRNLSDSEAAQRRSLCGASPQLVMEHLLEGMEYCVTCATEAFRA